MNSTSTLLVIAVVSTRSVRVDLFAGAKESVLVDDRPYPSFLATSADVAGKTVMIL
jgi:hypothetical protein